MATYYTTTSEETKELAKKFAHELHGGTVLCLYGDLGTGKTTFMQGILEGLGIQRRLVSPTFILMRTYDLRDISAGLGSTIETLYHADLYRLSSSQEIEGIGLLDALADSKGMVAIEWPEKMEELLPEQRVDIKLMQGTKGQDSREIVIEGVQKV